MTMSFECYRRHCKHTLKGICNLTRSTALQAQAYVMHCTTAIHKDTVPASVFQCQLYVNNGVNQSHSVIL